MKLFSFQIGIPVCILFLLTAGCSLDSPVCSTTPPKTFQLPTAEVKVEKIPVLYTTTGSVVSDARVEVSSRITGFIKNIAVHEGEIVVIGQLLITLDEEDVEGAINRISATVSKAEAALRDAETDVKRYKALFASGSTSDNALRKVCLQRDVASDSLREAKAALQTAVWQRHYTRIVSPVNGIVVERQKRNGDLATPGFPILTVESAQTLLFETYVPETRVANIQIGDKVAVDIDALAKTLKGTVTRIVPSGDPVTRRYLAKISMPDTDHLLPGMFGRAKYCAGYEKSPVISRSAFVIRGGLGGVFIIDKQNQVRFRWLRIAREWPDRLEVSAGLDGGEIIVAVNQPDLREGDIITNEVSSK